MIWKFPFLNILDCLQDKLYHKNQESKLLKIIRKNFEKIKQLKVKYKTGNIELIEVTTIKKVALESKIINHIKKSDYKKITIDIANGNIVNFEDTEKIKL